MKGHYKDENTSEISHMLVNISQEPKEYAHTFLFHAIELTERLLQWKSNDGEPDDDYDPELVQGKKSRQISVTSVKIPGVPFLSDVTAN